MGIEGSWVVELMEIDGEMVSPIEGSDISIVVDGDRVSGQAVNRFTGALGGETLFGPMASTRMAGPPELMAQEQVLLGHLDRVDSSESTMISLRTSGEAVLVLWRVGTK